MIGTKFYKPVKTEEECAAYNVAVDWCNSTQKGIIDDKGDYYEVIAVPAPSLEEVKTAKISGLKVIRDAKEVEPVQTDKGLFDYDDKSRDRLAIARQALTDAGGGEIVWTTADNQRVSMTIADFAVINGQAAVRSNELHIKYNELKTQVNACETVEEVEAIKWNEDKN
jgi:hypothetical protein